MDVAIRIGVLPDSDLQAMQLAPVRLVTCASPAYIERAGRPETPMDLLKHDCISAATLPSPSFIWRYAGVNRHQPLPVRGRFRTDDKDAMLDAALAGLGILHIATWLVSDQLRDGRLVALFPQELEAPLVDGLPGIHVVRAPGRGRSQRAKLFINHLRESIDEATW